MIPNYEKAHSLTLEGPTPTNISRNSDPETVMKGTLASPAVAFARRVFPVPGGPVNMAPRNNKNTPIAHVNNVQLTFEIDKLLENKSMNKV